MAFHVLTGIKTREVSIVDRGANRKKYAFKKRDGSMDFDVEQLKKCLETPMANEAELDAELEKAGTHTKASGAIKGAMRIMSAFADHMTDADTAKLANLLGLKPAASADNDDDEDDDDDDDDKKAPPKGSKGKRKGAKKNDDSPPAPAPDGEAEKEDTVTDTVTKAETELRAELKKAHDKQVDLEKRLEAEREVRLVAECVDVCKRDFPDMGAAADMGQVMRDLQKAGQWEAVEKSWRAAQAQIKKGALFTTRGHSDKPKTEGATALEQLMQKAEEIVKSSGGKMSEDKAFEQACIIHRDIYETYSAEKRG